MQYLAALLTHALPTVSRLSLFLFLLACCLPARSQDGPQDVRIRLLATQAPAEITVTAQSGMIRVTTGAEPSPILELVQGERLTLTRSRRSVTLRGKDTRFTQPSFLLEADGILEVAWRSGSQTRRRQYPGALLVQQEQGTLHLVNTVPFEIYVASVLNREYGLGDLEGSKAQAVVIRTYAWYAMQRRQQDAFYDLLDHEAHQVYHGVADLAPMAWQAAQATAGVVLTHQGEVVEAVYSSSSGGHTADNDVVWRGAARPYLRGRTDPYDRVSPHHRWTSSLNKQELLAALSTHFGTEITDVRIQDRSDDGRVQHLALSRKRGNPVTMRSNDFRLLITRAFGTEALRSTFFELRSGRTAYHFEGRGFGHGVGLSQWGAHGMAEAGKNYQEILDYYYTDVQLATLYSPPTQPPTYVSAQPAVVLPTRRKAPTRRLGW